MTLSVRRERVVQEDVNKRSYRMEGRLDDTLGVPIGGDQNKTLEV